MHKGLGTSSVKIWCTNQSDPFQNRINMRYEATPKQFLELAFDWTKMNEKTLLPGDCSKTRLVYSKEC